jgi:hypothetical protein
VGDGEGQRQGEREGMGKYGSMVGSGTLYRKTGENVDADIFYQTMFSQGPCKTE